MIMQVSCPPNPLTSAALKLLLCACCFAQGLLPLFWPQLRAGISVLFLGGWLALLAALGPAMWRMWIIVGSANANYFYAATLLFGAWQVSPSNPLSAYRSALLRRHEHPWVAHDRCLVVAGGAHRVHHGRDAAP